MIAQIFCALASLMVPPNTVKSCANTYTSRPVDRAPAGDHAVADDAPARPCRSRVAAVRDERADLDERAGVEQQFEALAGGQAALGVEFRDALGAAARQRLLAAPLELGEALLSVHSTSAFERRGMRTIRRAAKVGERAIRGKPPAFERRRGA